jgi:uncharacterized zinc-type alcohol dehydrogenase-like protein
MDKFMQTTGYAAHSHDTPLVPFDFERRALRDNDVAIAISHCGVCHSDMHIARNDWGWSTYPIVPGHEIVGEVTAVGPKVSRYKVGDRAAVGCLVDSCQQCDQCDKGEEQLCRQGPTGTYGSQDRVDGTPTYGGYSRAIVVREEFVCKVPDALDFAHAAPLLCAGITVYSPLRKWDCKPGTRVGVIGLGGLGHMAVKLAAAMGAHVTVLSRTADKRADALALGAHALLVSSDDAAMAAARDSLDLIIDTVPVEHALDPYLPLLDVDGSLVLVGQLGPMGTLSSLPLVMGRRRISGSPIGGIAETQEMLDFCAANGVVPEIEMIRMDEINHAYERLEKADVRYRFVIDMATL